MTAIGPLDFYDVRITDATDPATAYTTSAPTIVAFPTFSSLRWGRVLSGISSATIEVPIPTADLPNLTGWDMTLDVYRNGQRQWSGPVVGWKPGYSSTMISAHDILAWTKKRLVANNYSAVTEDPLSIITNMIDDIQTLEGQTFPFDLLRPDILHPGLEFGTVLSQDWRSAELQTLWDATFASFSEQVGFYFTAIPGSAFYDDASLQGTGFRYRPSLNLSTILGEPDVEVDALDACDHLFIGFNRFGVDGYDTVYDTTTSAVPNYTTFRLDGVAELTPSSSGETKNRRLALALRRAFPNVTIAPMTLDVSFGAGAEMNGMNGMIPGMIASWDFDSLPLNVMVSVINASSRPARLDIFSPPDPPVAFESSSLVLLRGLDVSVSVGEGGVSESIVATWEAYGQEE